jgi:hypothetical protein
MVQGFQGSLRLPKGSRGSVKEQVDKRTCGACGSKNVERVAFIAVNMIDSFYGPKCLDCGAYMDTESGKDYWYIGRRSTRIKA